MIHLLLVNTITNEMSKARLNKAKKAILKLCFSKVREIWRLKLNPVQTTKTNMGCKVYYSLLATTTFVKRQKAMGRRIKRCEKSIRSMSCIIWMSVGTKISLVWLILMSEWAHEANLSQSQSRTLNCQDTIKWVSSNSLTISAFKRLKSSTTRVN